MSYLQTALSYIQLTSPEFESPIETLVLAAIAAPLVGYVIWHTLGIILSSMVRLRSNLQPAIQPIIGRVAILYLTCNDFSPSACESLLNQEGVDFDVFILDDSTGMPERDYIDNWACKHGRKVQIIRRSDRVGYKGGNINHWLAHFGSSNIYPYILVADADEHIPPDFTLSLLQRLTSSEHVFAQGCHLGTAEIRTIFQALLHPQVECEWLHQVPAWNLYGIPPMLGHGVLLRTENLVAIGGFPNVISEDLGVTILLAERGLSGEIAANVIGYEEFPRSYRSYWSRRRRWIQADAEIVRKMLKMIWQGPSKWFSRLHLLIREVRFTLASSYWLLLSVTTIFSFLGLETNVVLSSWAWLGLIILLLPALVALSIKRLTLTRRFLYVLTMSFVGAATISLHPIASLLGLLGHREFEPTGSRHSYFGITNAYYLVWEVFSGLLFFSGGILADNWALLAVGFAIVCSPAMRTRWESMVLPVGVIAFWGLMAFQIWVDVSNSFLPLEHLLVLVGLTITLI